MRRSGPCDQVCWHTGLSWLKARAVYLVCILAELRLTVAGSKHHKGDEIPLALTLTLTVTLTQTITRTRT